MPKKAGLGDALKKVTAAPTTAPAPEAVHDDHRPPQPPRPQVHHRLPRRRRPSATAPARARTRQLRSTDGRPMPSMTSFRSTANRASPAEYPHDSMTPCRRAEPDCPRKARLLSRRPSAGSGTQSEQPVERPLPGSPCRRPRPRTPAPTPPRRHPPRFDARLAARFESPAGTRNAWRPRRHARTHAAALPTVAASHRTRRRPG